MFYFKITVRSKLGGREVRRTSVDHYRESQTRVDLGEAVAAFLGPRECTSVTVTKLSQAAYIRATRGSE